MKPLTIKEQINLAKKQLEELKAKIISISLPSVGKAVRVSIGEEKGNVLIYGLQRFPFAFYPNQLEKMRTILNSPEVAAFLEANKDKLSYEKTAE